MVWVTQSLWLRSCFCKIIEDQPFFLPDWAEPSIQYVIEVSWSLVRPEIRSVQFVFLCWPFFLILRIKSYLLYRLLWGQSHRYCCACLPSPHFFAVCQLLLFLLQFRCPVKAFRLIDWLTDHCRFSPAKDWLQHFVFLFAHSPGISFPQSRALFESSNTPPAIWFIVQALTIFLIHAWLEMAQSQSVGLKMSVERFSSHKLQRRQFYRHLQTEMWGRLCLIHRRELEMDWDSSDYSLGVSKCGLRIGHVVNL